MSRPSASTTEGWKPAVWLPLAVFVATVLVSVTGLWQTWDRAWADLLLRARLSSQPLALSPRIFPVDLTDSAERNLGQAIDGRQAFADLFKLLGDGKLAGGMDFLFSGLADPRADAAMADAAAKMDGLVLAVVPVDQATNQFTGRQYSNEEAMVVRQHLWHPIVRNPGHIPLAGTFLLPNLALAKASRHLGHVGVNADNDGVYRKVALFYRWEDGFMPSLPLAMAVFSQKIDTNAVVIDAGNAVELPTRQGLIRIPVDEAGCAWIPYPGVWDQGWQRTKLDKVVAAAAHPELEDEMLNVFGDGLVVAADLTTSHKDFGPNPIETVYPLSGIHTSMLNGILNQTFFRSAYPGEIAVLLFILVLGIVWITTRKTGWFLHAGFGILVLAVILWSFLAWWVFLVVPYFAVPVVGLVLAWAAALALRLTRTHEERTLMVSALSRYFPRALASRVLDEKSVDLVPAVKELSIMFSDISGFTKWSSDKPAELVHAFLSDYLESMALILFSHGGTVDKFMGDGILAFFGDPYEQPDHADRCLNAALAMQAKVKELQAVWSAKAGIDLKIRIGINTGRVIVGNLGSATRIEYTVIGSAVNLAQRMESNAPLEGILVTESTHEILKDKFSFSKHDVQVKGYSEAICAWVANGRD